MGAAVDKAATPPADEAGRHTTTVPAPPTCPPSGSGVLPSAFPTSIPAFDVQALATPHLPRDVGEALERCIPIRLPARVPADVDLRSAFLLMHVDGVSTVAVIANVAGFQVAATLEVFVELAALGLVVLSRTPEKPATAVSGVYPARLFDPE